MKQSEQDNFTFGAGVEATQDGENVAFLHEQKRWANLAGNWSSSRRAAREKHGFLLSLPVKEDKAFQKIVKRLEFRDSDGPVH